MASTTREGDDLEGVEFVREDDGSITAKDLQTGVARGGDTRAEALAQLAEVLELHEGGGESIENPDEFLRSGIKNHTNSSEVRSVEPEDDLPRHTPTEDEHEQGDEQRPCQRLNADQ